MGKKQQEVAIKAIEAIKALGVAYFEAAAANPIMATSGGLLPFVILSLVAPGAAQAGMIGVGAVAGMSSIPNVAVSTPLISFGISSYQAKWPSQVNIIKRGEGLMADEKKVKEATTLLKALGVSSLAAMG